MEALKKTFYPNLEHPVAELSAYALSMGLFIISLKSEEIIRFEPSDVAHFKSWLDRHKIRDINKDIEITGPNKE
ncbi:MAG: hypothetical protein BGO31_20685 [Bacteroidetes bacterium 43-16]|uniref:hypothetical protein n=1 Tax=uncultured Dysgonomonas sp. TaxID=206096 RepID=UPI00092BA59A|nr:hypothetical protein [uncultured Dysgonomonas sp.]OJV55349.1 MAG: hypothetical protein BGO31_20685 [Bacteroidetes bacterium 43-16]